MKKVEFIKEVQGLLGELGIKLNQGDTGELTDGLFSLIGDLAKEGHKVPLWGLGHLTVTERDARKGRNPQTGEEIDIPAKLYPKLTFSKKFKEQLND